MLRTQWKFFTVIFLFFNTGVSAQVNTSQILASAKNDVIFLLKNDQIDILRGNPIKLPQWDEVEFRMNNNRFEIDRNEYSLRLKKNPRGLIRQQERVYNSLIQVADIESVTAFSNALESRYKGILQSKFSSEIGAKRAELVLVLEDKKQAIENRLAYGLDDDLEDLADVELDLQEEAVSKLDFDFYKKQLENQIEFWAKSTEISFDNFISIEKINSITRELNSAGILNHPELKKRQSRSNLAFQEEIFERKEDQQLLNYLQVRYSDDPDEADYFREYLSVGVGLRLGAKKLKGLRVQELKVESLEAEKNVQIQKAELENEFAESVEELEFHFLKQKLLLKQLTDYKEKYAPEVLLSKGISKPLSLLKAKETILKKEIEIIKTEFDLYEQYIKVLFSSGKPIELPMRNYLTESLEEF